MLAIKGTYKDGKILLPPNLEITKPTDVIIIFIEDIEISENKKLDLRKFSFNKSRALLKDYKEVLSDVIIEERRSVL